VARRFFPASRRVRLAVLAASAAVLVATPVSWALTRPAADVGVVPAAISSVPEPSAATYDPTAPEVPSIPVHSARLADQPAVRTGPRPVRLRIPAIGVNARVIPVGVHFATRSVQVPNDIADVGWYRFGPSPGGPGSAILLGHVDSEARGAGVFFRLQQLKPGALVTVRFRSGRATVFRVVARRAYPKQALPAAVFRRSGPASLTLITCGGAFNASTGHYADNIVVYAVPRHSS
jgi:sortase (surface protein transpeptidase)